MNNNNKKADVCLFLEGTYPYVRGGVARWTHDFILSQKDLTFTLVCIVPPVELPSMKYELPPNVVGIDHIFLQELPPTGDISNRRRKELFQELEMPLLNLQLNPKLDDLKMIQALIQTEKHKLSEEVLLNSYEAWEMCVRMYLTTIGGSSFLDYFWSWRGLLGSFYTILLAKLPQARLYHAFSTGYAGLALACARNEMNKPCILSEHGIYTNERRIEIISAAWIQSTASMDLSLERPRYEFTLQDFWIDFFSSFSKLAYQASNIITTLFEGNRQLQLSEGADPERTRIIPNGIDSSRYAKLRHPLSATPTIALVGRVVPIKDVQTFIHAAEILQRKIPNLRAWIIGPTEEDEFYYNECLNAVKERNLENIIIFTGNVSNIDEYLKQIDVAVLTSISEAQPLIILEAGAAGIPCVATDVGSCKEMIYGKPDEDPPLGAGGEIAPLSNPGAVAEAIERLLTDPVYYKKCQNAIQKRIETYYQEVDQNYRYRKMYDQLMEGIS